MMRYSFKPICSPGVSYWSTISVTLRGTRVPLVIGVTCVTVCCSSKDSSLAFILNSYHDALSGENMSSIDLLSSFYAMFDCLASLLDFSKYAWSVNMQSLLRSDVVSLVASIFIFFLLSGLREAAVWAEMFHLVLRDTKIFPNHFP